VKGLGIGATTMVPWGGKEAEQPGRAGRGQRNEWSRVIRPGHEPSENNTRHQGSQAAGTPLAAAGAVHSPHVEGAGGRELASQGFTGRDSAANKRVDVRPRPGRATGRVAVGLLAQAGGLFHFSLAAEVLGRVGARCTATGSAGWQVTGPGSRRRRDRPGRGGWRSGPVCRRRWTGACTM